MKTNKLTFLLVSLLFLSAYTKAAWQNKGPYGGTVTAFIDFQSKVFAGTLQGVYQSSDNGQQWTASRNGMGNIRITAFTINENIIFAGTEKGIYKSPDGLNWTVSNTGLTSISVSSLISKEGLLFAGTPDGVFRSDNNGSSWTIANSGIPATYYVDDFAKGGSDTGIDTIYGATLGAGLFLSTNNGASWQQVSSIPATFIYDLIQTDNLMFAGTAKGVYKSENRGITWSLSNTGLSASAFGNSFAIAGNVVLLGSHNEGIFKSTDYGATWTGSSTGIPDYPYSYLPHNYPTPYAMIYTGGNFLAGTIDGVFRSVNSGDSWTRSNTGLKNLSVVSLSCGNGRVFAATENNGVHISADGGATWTRSYNNLTTEQGSAVEVIGSNTFLALKSTHFFYSPDNGTTWNNITGNISGNGTDFAVSGQDVFVSTVTAGKANLGGVFKLSPDQGGWSASPVFPDIEALSLAVSGTDIFASTYDGKVYHSSDHGQTWNSVSTGLPGSAVNSLTFKGSTLFAGTLLHGVYKSDNMGILWTSSNTGLGSNAVNVIKSNGSDLFAGTDDGFYKSNDNGATWIGINDGLDNRQVKALDANPTAIYAGTPESVYQRPVAEVTSIQENAKEELAFSLYPNPSSGKVFITTATLPLTGIQYIVTDISGRVIETKILSQDVTEINLEQHPKGIYFIQMKSEDFVNTQKIIIE